MAGPPENASPEFLAAFRAGADAGGRMSFAGFMQLALYHPEVGYYRKSRTRIGYGDETDFYTSSTSGPVFGELVSAACIQLLGDSDPAEFSFVEIGAEPARAETPGAAGVLAGVAHPFHAVRTIGPAEPVAISGRCILFSNELLDAQPFARFVRRAGSWREIGVRVAGERLEWTELDTPIPPFLPPHASEGFVIDAPVGSVALLRHILGQPWEGLFVAADYGKSWSELTTATPAGTARAYYRHTQTNDLLARPGEQDLTCHICWDWVADTLKQHRFGEPELQTQESFFIRHAARFAAAASAADAARFTPRKLSLMQLLHPAHLGQKFQVMHARRL